MKKKILIGVVLSTLGVVNCKPTEKQKSSDQSEAKALSVGIQSAFRTVMKQLGLKVKFTVKEFFEAVDWAKEVKNTSSEIKGFRVTQMRGLTNHAKVIEDAGDIWNAGVGLIQKTISTKFDSMLEMIASSSKAGKETLYGMLIVHSQKGSVQAKTLQEAIQKYADISSVADATQVQKLIDLARKAKQAITYKVNDEGEVIASNADQIVGSIKTYLAGSATRGGTSRGGSELSDDLLQLVDDVKNADAHLLFNATKNNGDIASALVEMRAMQTELVPEFAAFAVKLQKTGRHAIPEMSAKGSIRLMRETIEETLKAKGVATKVDDLDALMSSLDEVMRPQWLKGLSENANEAFETVILRMSEDSVQSFSKLVSGNNFKQALSNASRNMDEFKKALTDAGLANFRNVDTVPIGGL